MNSWETAEPLERRSVEASETFCFEWFWPLLSPYFQLTLRPLMILYRFYISPALVAAEPTLPSFTSPSLFLEMGNHLGTNRAAWLLFDSLSPMLPLEKLAVVPIQVIVGGAPPAEIVTLTFDCA